MEWAMESKLLDFNLDKFCYIIFGPKRSKNALREESKANPLTLCKREMKGSLYEKLLGDVLSSEGLADSVRATVDKRKGQVLKTSQK